jgi:hypothetical protein
MHQKIVWIHERKIKRFWTKEVWVNVRFSVKSSAKNFLEKSYEIRIYKLINHYKKSSQGYFSKIALRIL